MTQDDLDRLFDALCDLAPEERAVRLTGLDPETRVRLENVLEHYDAMLEAPEAMPALGGIEEEVAHFEDSPRRLGPYRVLGVIGSGGMGVVYRAEQSDPKRQVAIKVLRSANLIAEHGRRFEREAELLARLQHRGIAQVFEMGRTEEAAYLVMELIDGERLTTWAEARSLGRDERLKLVIELADAVHHAHLRGVVHRDLKPANVLVDSAGQVKVIDFGVARALDADRQATLETRIGQIVGTLGYMSPEQVRGDLGAIDARADVYALGVLAYELLSGRLPHDLGSKSLTEAGRVILEVDPPPLGRVAPDCRGDLALIVGKALEKEPDRRYASAAAFAADIERFRNHQPIDSRPPGLWYQLSKLARRNRTLVAGALATLTAIVAGGAVAWSQAVTNKELAAKEATARIKVTESYERAERLRASEAERAAELQQVVSYQEGLLFRIDARQMSLGIREDLLGGLREADPSGELLRQGQDILKQIDLVDVASHTLQRHLLEPARQELDRQFPDQPLVRARLLVSLGHAQMKAGFRSASVLSLKEAVRLQQDELGARDRETLTTQVDLAGTLNSAGEHEEAFQMYRDLEGAVVDVLGSEDPGTVDLLLGLGAGFAIRGDGPRAEDAYSQALKACETVYGPDSRRAFVIRSSLARALAATGELARSEALLRELVAESAPQRAQGHPPAILLMGDLAAVLINQEQHEEAEPLAREAADRMRRRLGGGHPATVDLIERHAICLAGLERHAEAEPELREVIRSLRAQGEPALERLAARLADLAKVLEPQGELVPAEDAAQEALRIAEELSSSEIRRTALECLRDVYGRLDAEQPGHGYAEKAEEIRTLEDR